MNIQQRFNIVIFTRFLKFLEFSGCLCVARFFFLALPFVCSVSVYSETLEKKPLDQKPLEHKSKNQELPKTAKPKSGCASEYAECAPIGKWEFAVGMGLGLRTNPLYFRDDLPIILLPSVSYYGERFFIENLRAGFTLFDNQRSHMMNMVVTAGFEQVYFEDLGLGNFFLDGGGSFEASSGGSVGSPALNEGGGSEEPPAVGSPPPGNGVSNPGVDPVVIVDGSDASQIDVDNIEKRKTAGLAGFEYQYNIDTLAFNFQALADVTKVHSGLEARWSVSYPFSVGDSDLGIAFGGVWQDAKLLNYYYGVSENDTDNDQALFAIEKGGMSTFLRLDWRKELSKKWSLKATINGKLLSQPIKDSPLVEDDTVYTVFFGGVYRF